MEIGKVYIMISKGDRELITIDKIITLDEYFSSNYVNHRLYYNEGFVNNTIGDYFYVELEEYLKEPEKWERFYQKHELILKMWNEFLKHDIVEARKFKLKLLEEYGK